MKKSLLIMMILLIGLSGCKEKTKPIIDDEGSIELLEDPTFATGFQLLGISPVEDGRTIQRHLNYNGEALPSTRNVWFMAQWWTPYDVTDATYEKLNGVHTYTTESRTLYMNPSDEGYLRIDLNASKEYLDGPRELGQPWTHALIEQNFNASVGMSELSALILRLEVTVNSVENKTGPTYDPGKHAAQLLWYLTLQNVVPEDSNPAEVGTRGDFLWFGIPIYDNRTDFISQSAHLDQGGPGTTNKLIYSMSSRNYFDEKIQMGKTYQIEIDVLPYLQEAFLYAINNNALVNAQYENMQIGYMNLGWELPGTFDVSSTFRGISIKAIKK
ncbi:hypothetical protein [Paracholeplasma manati]|uniref:hypothetical protein n=1 Tax=Paracholeplasma manati TaxID=591373 RepID=UPI0024081FEF|nr:hypothetical protein [Paracholeplasma manati]MDG0888961.1 hypothetical protein [Paracholeplasma manati]